MSRRRFGAVRKLPSGRWQVRFRQPSTGHYQTAPGTFATKTEAGRWLSMLEADTLRGVWVDPTMGEVRFKDVAERWLATKAHLRPSTRSLYDWLLVKHILPTFGNRPIGTITTLDLQMWISAGLRRCDVNALHRTVRVERQLTEVNSQLSFHAPKTNAGLRTIIAPQFVIDVLADHLARWSAPGPDGLIFVMPEGTPLRRENSRKRVWLPACRSAGVTGLRFHDLRHTGATLAAASGAPLRAVMHRLGHASAAAAIRYQHRVAGQDEAIADYLDRIGRSAVPPQPAEVRRLGS